MDLVSRVKNILLDPQNEWRVIDGEPDPPNVILKNYVAILAAIPVVCGFIGASIIGVGPYRTGILLGLIGAIIGEALSNALGRDPTLRNRITEARDIVDFRNVLVHGYSGIENGRVWLSIQRDLPRLLAEVRALLSS